MRQLNSQLVQQVSQIVLLGDACLVDEVHQCEVETVGLGLEVSLTFEVFQNERVHTALQLHLFETKTLECLVDAL